MHLNILHYNVQLGVICIRTERVSKVGRKSLSMQIASNNLLLHYQDCLQEVKKITPQYTVEEEHQFPCKILWFIVTCFTLLSPTHAHTKKCEGGKDERQGKPGNYYPVTVDATPLFIRIQC